MVSQQGRGPGDVGDHSSKTFKQWADAVPQTEVGSIKTAMCEMASLGYHIYLSETCCLGN
jgi:hypothetical protein